MAKRKKQLTASFPEGFLWGAATAAHQVEGDQNNNWSRWEPKVAGRLAKTAEARLKPQVPRWDLIAPEATQPDNYISATAAEHYKRYEKDFDLMAKLGLKAYRFSVEWSRIEPKPGHYDKKELDHYMKVIEALQARGIEPFVSLHHFTNPVWLDKQGGWHEEGVVEKFADFAAVVARHFGDKVKFWITINEPGSYLLMRYLGGGIWPEWPEMETNPVRAYKYLRNVVRAHKAACLKIKLVNLNSQVGLANGMIDFELARRDPLSRLQKRLNESISTNYLLDRTRDYLDFIGVNYYVHMEVKAKFASVREWTKLKLGQPANDMGWGVYPAGIYNVTQSLQRRYGLPMYITENGLPDKEDQFRQEFIEDHLTELHRSLENGADIRGYLHWSLLDNFEWSEGFWPKFGLIEVDRKTQKRTLRPSAKAYAKIVKANGL